MLGVTTNGMTQPSMTVKRWAKLTSALLMCSCGSLFPDGLQGGFQLINRLNWLLVVYGSFAA